MVSARDVLAAPVLRYSQVWEDHSLLERGLVVGPEDDVLCVSGAGDNALALLLQEPRSLCAVDLNPAQTQLLRLKLAAIAHGEPRDLPAVLGLADRPATEAYDSLRHRLDAGCRAHWDDHADLLAEGLARSGRLERYFIGFQRDHLRLIHDPDRILAFLRIDDLAEQRRVFHAEIATPELEAAFVTYFDRDNMERSGRDPSQFAHVEERQVGRSFWRRFVWACTALPVRGNFYLHWFLTGSHDPQESGPVYLRPAAFAPLRALAPRMRVVTAEVVRLLEESPPGTFSKIALSDVLEYLSPDEAAQLLRSAARALRAGGRLAYWNLLVPRSSAMVGVTELTVLDELSERLSAEDRSWFYRAFVIERRT